MAWLFFSQETAPVLSPWGPPADVRLACKALLASICPSSFLAAAL